jgi:dipeptidyl aminopeptidase/acylaminoacyl peptidase
MKTVLTFIVLIFLPLLGPLAQAYAQDTLQTKNTQAILFSGKNKSQPLIVGLGGSEGGNAWAGDHWKQIREQFLARGYAFLAIGYFNTSGTPKELDKIAVEDIHDAIAVAANHTGVDPERIAIVGGSRGADLAMLVASYYKDIKCVVALVPSHTVFPGNTGHLSASSWTYQGRELPFVPVTREAVPALMSRNLRRAFEIMLKDTAAENRSLIKVENINGPLLLISATKDEICPSSLMSEKIIVRLKAFHTPYYNQHIAIEGNHTEPLKHFDLVFHFLDQYFPVPE